MVKPIIFGTDGWRAIIADQFTFDNVELVTKAVAAYIKTAYDSSKPVVIGYDTRFLADKFALRAANVLNDLGFNVLLTESDAPTPVVAFAAKNLNSAGALMFTASHNPPEYCGIKYIPDYAGPATPDITDVIVANVAKLQAEDETVISASEKKGTTEKFDPKPEYFKWVNTLIDFDKIKTSGINVIYDPLYSTGRGYFDGILEDHGFKVTTINNWVDPLYGGGMPEPKEEFLEELIELVKETDGAIGFSTDGDADRFGVVDDKGNYVTPNEVIAIIFKHLIKNKNRKGSVVKTVATSQMIDKIAQMNGNIKVHETAVGFKYIGQIMRNENVIVGGEESGGLSIWGHIPEKDGIVANLSILEAVAYEGKPLSQLVEDLKNEIGTHYINNRIDLHLTEETKNAAMKMFLENPPKEVGGIKVANVNKLDGVKFVMEDGESWILVRASGTEPLLRIYFETDSQEKLEKLVNSIKEDVNSL